MIMGGGARTYEGAHDYEQAGGWWDCESCACGRACVGADWDSCVVAGGIWDSCVALAEGEEDDLAWHSNIGIRVQEA